MPFIAIVLATSLYSVHCLVPTHPGALAAAGLLKVDIGTLILVGTLFAFPAAITAFYWTKWRTNSGQITHKEDLPDVESIADQKLPSVFLSLLPIVVPLLLISVNSLLTAFGYKNQNGLIIALIFIGQPVIALFTGMLLSLLLIGFRKMETINGIFESAIIKAGPILIVTAAGGMFGMVIKETGVGAYAGEVLVKTGLGLAVPFLFAFLLKTAQGSSTVAIITASSFIAPMLPALGLDTETGKIMTMIVMGAGSMMISHANDSYFWVITRFSNIQTDTTLKVYSSATIVMGITVFVCALAVSRMVL
jgi:GntP family gluconate:H+ symporter